MILNDKAIAREIDEGNIIVEPSIEAEQIQPASLDIRMGKSFRLKPKEGREPLSLEWIELPNDIGAFMTGRSSVGRKHIVVHQTAGWLDPGFRGQIKLEMYNHSHNLVEFNRGQRVSQLIFMRLEGESDGYGGQYQDQGEKP